MQLGVALSELQIVIEHRRRARTEVISDVDEWDEEVNKMTDVVNTLLLEKNYKESTT